MLGFRAPMRRLILGVSFLALIGITCLLWAFRFERVEGLPIWGLPEIRSSAVEIPGMEWLETSNGSALRAFVGPSHSMVGGRLAIPRMVPADFLHLRFRLAASELKPGGRSWEDGRLMVEWHSVSDPSKVETDVVGTIRDDIKSGLQDIVVGTEHPPALPTLRVEHLGRSGEFTISELRIEVIRERWIWRIGRWILCGFWWALAYAFIRSWPRIGCSRAAIAAGIWVFMGLQFVIPGPWKIQKPIYPSFQLGPESRGIHPISPNRESGASTTNTIPVSGPLPPLAELPIQGSLFLKLKHTIQQARPMLHMLMLFGPMCVLSLLVGLRPAFWLSAAIAILIEMAQVAFGYGFGWDDISDLTCDFAGIALAAWLVAAMAAKIGKRFPGFRFLLSPGGLSD